MNRDRIKKLLEMMLEGKEGVMVLVTNIFSMIAINVIIINYNFLYYI